MGCAAVNRLQLTEDIGQLIGLVLHVQDQPIETAVGQNFGADVTSQVRPQTNL